MAQQKKSEVGNPFRGCLPTSETEGIRHSTGAAGKSLRGGDTGTAGGCQ